MMKKPELIPWLERFFREYLSTQRNLSPATIAAYHDTFRLLFRFLRTTRRTRSALPLLEVLSPGAILAFLEHLEQKRGNCIRTRNARLAAIRSFIHYVRDWLGPDFPSAASRILCIPFKRHEQPLVGFLTRQEVQAILAATDETWTGRRDYLLFLLLYNTGARISEILGLKVRDISLQDRRIQILGKGRKQRQVPIWPQTQKCLRRWLKVNPWPPEAPLLPNRFGQRLSRAGAAYQLQQLVHRASVRIPALKERRVSPHSFRHGTAMALLEANVPTEVIALFLGHESPKTTHTYVEASLAMKKEALLKVPPLVNRTRFHLKDDDFFFLEHL